MEAESEFPDEEIGVLAAEFDELSQAERTKQAAPKMARDVNWTGRMKDSFGGVANLGRGCFSRFAWGFLPATSMRSGVAGRHHCRPDPLHGLEDEESFSHIHLNHLSGFGVSREQEARDGGFQFPSHGALQGACSVGRIPTHFG